MNDRAPGPSDRGPSPLRVAVIVDRLDARKGGMEAVVTRFVRYAVERGHDLRVYALAPAASIEDAGAAFVRIPAPRLRFLREPAFAERAVKRARADGCDVTLAIRHVPDADVLWSHGGPWITAWSRRVASFSPAIARAKRAFAVIGPKHRALASLERRVVAPSGPRLVAVSSRVREDYVELDVDPARISVVPNGLGPSWLPPREPSREEESAVLSVFLVAHNFRLKGVATLVRAVARLRDSGTRVSARVAGRGNPRPYLRLAKRLDVGDAVEFLGAVGSVEELVRHYRESDAFVLPTWHDPCATATLEAMACGRPVVTTRFDGAIEPPVAPEEAPFVLEDPGDDAALARALARLADPVVRRSASTRSLDRVRGREERAAFRAIEEILARAAADRSHGQRTLPAP